MIGRTNTRPASRALRGRGMLRHGVWLIAFWMAASAPCQAREPQPTAAELADAKKRSDFREKYGIFVLSPGGNSVPDMIRGTRLSEPIEGGAPEDAFYQFMLDNVDLMRIPDPRSVFILASPPPGENGSINQRFTQVHGGIPVNNSTVHTGFSAEGRLTSIMGKFYPGMDAPTTPAISNLDARQIARDNGPVPGYGDIGGEEELVIYATDSAYYLAWDVRLSYHELTVMRHLVDAVAGVQIRRMSLSGTSPWVPTVSETWDKTAPFPTLEDDERRLRELKRYRESVDSLRLNRPKRSEGRRQVEVRELNRSPGDSDGRRVRPDGPGVTEELEFHDISNSGDTVYIDSVRSIIRGTPPKLRVS